MPATTAVVILAAGAGSRYGGDGHKLLATLPANGAETPATVIERSLAHVLDAAIGPVIVIRGAAPDIVPVALIDQVTVRHNRRWAEGQMTSLRAGLAAAAELDCSSVVVGLADQPFITPAAWRSVATTSAPFARGVNQYAGGGAGVELV